MNNISTASCRIIRTSPRKLSLLAGLIRGMRVAEARKQLAFSTRKILAGTVGKCLDSAIANAENNHGLDVDRLVIKTITVGKAIVMKRFMPRGRGKSSSICKKFSNLYITLEEKFKV